jgi:hypothetical protein
LNILLKKPIKFPFSINTKKAVITATKGECHSVDDDNLGNTRDEVTINLQKEYNRILSRPYITKRKNGWLVSNQRTPFHKERKSKKLAKIYFQIDPDKTSSTIGQAMVLSNIKLPPKERKTKKNS